MVGVIPPSGLSEDLASDHQCIPGLELTGEPTPQPITPNSATGTSKHFSSGKISLNKKSKIPSCRNVVSKYVPTPCTTIATSTNKVPQHRCNSLSTSGIVLTSPNPSGGLLMSRTSPNFPRSKIRSYPSIPSPNRPQRQKSSGLLRAWLPAWT